MGSTSRDTGWLRVAVAGASMAPTLRDGDWLLCRSVQSADVQPGQIVVAEQPNRLGFIIIKRAIRRTEDGWWVEGDNSASSDDSRSFGPIPDDFVRAVVRWRYWPRPSRITSH